LWKTSLEISITVKNFGIIKLVTECTRPETSKSSELEKKTKV